MKGKEEQYVYRMTDVLRAGYDVWETNGLVRCHAVVRKLLWMLKN
jgi:hypothetical protein